MPCTSCLAHHVHVADGSAACPAGSLRERTFTLLSIPGTSYPAYRLAFQRNKGADPCPHLSRTGLCPLGASCMHDHPDRDNALELVRASISSSLF